MDGVLEVLSQLAQHPDVVDFFVRHPELAEVVEVAGNEEPEPQMETECESFRTSR